MHSILLITSTEPGGEWHTTDALMSALAQTHMYKISLIGMSHTKVNTQFYKTYNQHIIITLLTPNRPLRYLKKLIKEIQEIRRVIIELTKKETYSIIICTDYKGKISTLTIPALWKTQQVFYFHGRKTDIFKQWYQKNYFEIISSILEKFALATSSKIITPSQFGKTILSSLIPFIDNKIHIVPNFLPYTTHQPITKPSQQTLQILYAGRLVTYKGLPILIDSILSLHNMGYDIQLTICYPTINAEKDLLDHVRSIKKQYPLLIKTFPDANTNTLQRVYTSSDLLVLPSRMEISPVSFLEAFHYGTVCISSNTGNAVELLSAIDPKCILTDISQAAIIKTLLWYMCLPKKIKKHYQSKAQKIAKQYTPEQTTHAFLSVINSV